MDDARFQPLSYVTTSRGSVTSSMTWVRRVRSNSDLKNESAKTIFNEYGLSRADTHDAVVQTAPNKGHTSAQ